MHGKEPPSTSPNPTKLEREGLLWLVRISIFHEETPSICPRQLAYKIFLGLQTASCFLLAVQHPIVVAAEA